MTAPITKRNPLDGIAPYPTREDEATAEAMAKHYAAFAQMHNHMVTALIATNDRDQWSKSIANVVAYYGVTYLLRELEERAGTKQADEVAQLLWLAWQEGSSVGLDLWEWLEEDGIDPEAVNEVAGEVYKALQEKAASGSPS
jgi:hypothetical protein